MVGDSTIKFDVCRQDNDVARFNGWIPRDDDFGGVRNEDFARLATMMSQGLMAGFVDGLRRW